MYRIGLVVLGSSIPVFHPLFKTHQLVDLCSKRIHNALHLHSESGGQLCHKRIQVQRSICTALVHIEICIVVGWLIHATIWVTIMVILVAVGVILVCRVGIVIRVTKVTVLVVMRFLICFG